MIKGLKVDKMKKREEEKRETEMRKHQIMERLRAAEQAVPERESGKGWETARPEINEVGHRGRESAAKEYPGEIKAEAQQNGEQRPMSDRER